MGERKRNLSTLLASVTGLLLWLGVAILAAVVVYWFLNQIGEVIQ